MDFRKYRIKEKMWSFNDEYKIYDQNEMLAYVAKGKKFVFKKHLVFSDWQGKELFMIRQKMWTFKFTFFLQKEDRDLCKVIRNFSLKPVIEVHSLDEDYNLTVRGNLWGNQYHFYHGEDEIAFVSKDLWKLAGHYGVAIREDQHDAKILATVVIIDIIQSIEGAA